MAVVTPTDRPNSVRNRCVIEDFGGVFVLSIFKFSVGMCFFFYHRTESDLLLSLLFHCLSQPSSSIMNLV